jgi:hypothetical protein
MKPHDPLTTPQMHSLNQADIRELTARELDAIGGGRAHGASPDLLTEPPPPHCEK